MPGVAFRRSGWKGAREGSEGKSGKRGTWGGAKSREGEERKRGAEGAALEASGVEVQVKSALTPRIFVCGPSQSARQVGCETEVGVRVGVGAQSLSALRFSLRLQPPSRDSV
eukprot:3880186-Rhodomonas_salina.1